MRMLILLVAFAAISHVVFAKVHKFSPGFQAVI